MPRVGKTQHALSEFEGHIHMHCFGALIRPLQQVLCVGKPDELPVKSKMHFDEAGIEIQEEILSPPPYFLHAPPLDELRELRRCLRLASNRMKNVHASDALPAHQWTQRSCDGFYF